MLSTVLQVVGLVLVVAAAALPSLVLGAVAFCVLYVADQAGKAGR